MMTREKRNLLAILGPGFITAALVLGPGSLTVSSKIGATQEFRLLWVVPVCVLFMSAFVVVSTRIGTHTNESLLQIIRQRYGKVVCLLIGIGLFLVAASFQAGNSIGAGMVFSEWTGSAPTPWIVAFSVLALILLFFQNFFKILERLMIFLVVIMLLSFLATLIVAQPDWGRMIEQFSFGIPDGSEFLVLALIASSFSLAGAFYQSYLVQEKNKGVTDSNLVGKMREKEGLSGILILGVITSMVILVAASVLHPQGIQVNSATEMGKALEPLFGRYASVVFMAGLFAASFSSLIGNATLGGVLLSDALSLGMRLESKRVRAMIMLVIVLGALVAGIFGRLPIQLIITAQAMTVIIVPLIGLMIIMVARDLMHKGVIKLGLLLQIFLYVGLLLVVGLAIANAYRMLKG